jgi:hypothetical protein
MSTVEDAKKRHPASIDDPKEAAKFLLRRHAEYPHIYNLCNWILDTWEGGDRYKRARYDVDPIIGSGIIGNLIRHRREWPIDDVSLTYGTTPDDIFAQLFVQADVTADPNKRMIQSYNRAADTNYEIRVTRTPTPTKLKQVINKHVAEIHKQAIRRHVKGTGKDDTPTVESKAMEAVTTWWVDVDGRQTSMDEWMRETVGPLLCALGMLDILCDHPSIADDYPTLPGKGDVAADDPSGRCHAQYILPQDVLWYRLDYTRRYYIEVLIREWVEDYAAEGPARWVETIRHWTREGWTLYRPDGTIVDEGTYPYRRVPIVRCFDGHHPRIEHAGDPRFFGIVEKSREYYNEESELIYAMDLQCFAFLQCPPTAFNDAGDAIPMGPGMAIMMQEHNDTLWGYQYVVPPMSPLEFMLKRLDHLESQMDAEAGLQRPMTAVGSQGGTREASGISKSFDQDEASNILAGMALSMQAAEYATVEMAATVLLDRPPTRAELQTIEVVYPTKFNLLTYQQMSVMVEAYVYARENSGYIPTGEEYILQWMMDYMVRGIDPESRDKVVEEIAKFVQDKVKSVADGKAQVAAMNAANVPANGQAKPFATIQAPPAGLIKE